MLAQTVRRSLLEARSILPPTFLLPFRARITTASHTLETANTVPESLLRPGQHIAEDLKEKTQLPKDTKNAPLTPSTPSPAVPSQQPPNTPQTTEQSSPLTPQIRKLLPLLHSQAPHYMTLHIHGHPYLLTAGDTLRLPFLMPRVQPGDILRLNRATHIGSRDFTLKAPEPAKGTRDAPKKVFYLDERLFECRATVVGVESEPMRVKEKTKRRMRHVRRVKSKHRFTVLKISEVRVKGLEEYERAVGA
ncbi:hypothetical protein GQ43DRAFT_442316 [Delitschia confertaspora ATCC 74209]|uniref:Large ribosomal subunit protein bL21m n=1 Tax=Delitschia confertaspora ATCC 74209 TaxID=1513339 RepID=A0A9P4MU17_9PLEO|nr:hypothetical protein GQ43DRAFT_442316 [Delitschia confertaspora ATCC 74209]